MSIASRRWIVALLLVPGGIAGCASNSRDARVEAEAARNSALIGRSAPDFTLPDQDGRAVHLADFRGKWVVVYFYPADGTPGCTCQAKEFTKTHSEFEQLDAVVLGVSPDSVERHQQFTRDFKLKVRLLADPERGVMREYGAAVQGPQGARVVRSTVLIDPAGRVAYHWPEVVPEGHAERVRAELERQRGRPVALR
jgi:peroxiredoxin Q/BCP